MHKEVTRDLIDSTLEIAVVPSFSRAGPIARSRLYNWMAPASGGLAGRTALVTGPTSGLGRETARGLADLGARVVLVGHSPDRLRSLATELAAAAGEDRFPVVVADMSALASVRAAVAQIQETEPRIDVLVDNAGAIYPEWAATPEGIERSLAVLVCGPFVLLSGLLPLLENSKDARVIAVTSGGMYTQPVDLGDLEWRERPFSGPRAYAQSKRIQVMLMREWARRTRGSRIAFNAMHPGWADTPGLADTLTGFYQVMTRLKLLRSPAEGIDTILWLATSPDIRAPGGRLYLDRRPRPFDRLPRTRLSADDRAELWDAITELTAGPPLASQAGY